MRRWIACMLALLMLVPAALAEETRDMAALTLESVKWCVQLPKDAQVIKAVAYSCGDFEGYPVEALLIAATPSEEAQAFRGAAAGLLLVDLADGRVYTDSDFPVFEGQPVQSREDALLWLFNSWASNWYQENVRLWTENETCVPLTEDEIKFVNDQLMKYFTAPGFTVPAEPPMEMEVPAEQPVQAKETAEPQIPAEQPVDVAATAEPERENASEGAKAEESVDRGEFGWAGTWLPYVYGEFQGNFVVRPDNTCELDGRAMRMEPRNMDRTDLFTLYEGDSEVGYLSFIPEKRSVHVVIGEGAEAFTQNFYAEWMYEQIELTAENLMEYFAVHEEWEFEYDLFDEVEAVRYRQELQIKPEYGVPDHMLSKVAVEYSAAEACYDCSLDADAQTAELLQERWRRDPNTKQMQFRVLQQEDGAETYGQMLMQNRVYDDDGLCVTAMTDLEILRVKGTLFIPIQ